MRKEKQEINGVLLLNKDLGASSNKALQQVKYLFNAKKAGHTGTLDPLATGLLPICFGRATKLTQFMLDSNKVYFTIASLGKTTSTGDAEGEILEEKVVPNFSKEEILEVLEGFKGEIVQIPPIYSALKQNGVPLYQLAREGRINEIDITAKARKIQIIKLELVDFVDNQIHLNVQCSKGTYIRTLVEDIGRALQVGAFVSELHRTKTANFNIENSYKFVDLQNIEKLNNCLLQMDCLVEHLDKIYIDNKEIRQYLSGQKISFENVNNLLINQIVRLYDNERFLGLAKIVSENQFKININCL